MRAGFLTRLDFLILAVAAVRTRADWSAACRQVFIPA
jgi:hypothetical protein